MLIARMTVRRRRSSLAMLLAAAMIGVGCGTGGREWCADPRTAEEVTFSPSAARVGDVIRVEGSRFDCSEVDVVLVPEGQLKGPMAAIDGDLFVLGRAATFDGSFSTTVVIAEVLKSQTGTHRLRVEPASYQVGAYEPGTLRATGPLAIVP
jgi:hypothetical protein